MLSHIRSLKLNQKTYLITLDIIIKIIEFCQIHYESKAISIINNLIPKLLKLNTFIHNHLLFDIHFKNRLIHKTNPFFMIKLSQ